ASEGGCGGFPKDLEGTGVTVNILVPGGPTDTPGFFPPGKPRPPFLLDPEIMGAPAAWLAPPPPPAPSPPATGPCPCRRRRPRPVRARRRGGPHSRRAPARPAAIRCSRRAAGPSTPPTHAVPHRARAPRIGSARHRDST